MASCRLQIVQALRGMNSVKNFGALQFDKNRFFHQEIGCVRSNDDAVIVNIYHVLLGYNKAALTDFMSHGVLINLFKKTRSKPVSHPERASDNAFR